MKTIQLTQNQEAVVDDEDYEWLSQWKWFANWCPDTKSYYAARNMRLPNGKRTAMRMNRAILGLEYGDRRQGDHKNHDTLDNRRDNLRIVDHGENMRNQKSPKGYCKDGERFLAQIQVDGKKRNLGRYATPREARSVYFAAKRSLHPTFVDTCSH